MRQFQITVPEEKGEEVEDWLRNEAGIAAKDIATIHSCNNFIIFVRASQTKSFMLLQNLEGLLGVGRRFGTIDVFNLEITKPQLIETEDKKLSGRKERLMTEQMQASVVSQNRLSFDFIAFLIAASIIAGAGLATNNAVVVVASMLVSPLMGPILGFTFGVMIKDHQMVWLGLKNEAIALIISVLVGILLGVVLLPFGSALDWPTTEMSSRGDPWVLLIGILVAAPSGAGVALSVTSGGVNTLVGVAISASLLPPAVNTGIEFLYGIFGPFVIGDSVRHAQHLRIAGISFCLVLVNIACINIVGMLFFKIKEINKVTGASKKWKDFATVGPGLYHSDTLTDITDDSVLSHMEKGYSDE
eukprot:CAMPEP_0174275110 /NCGR_PEP_ID=MMETSP0439-20130205/59650_1 /TAXON_ID=0 /ORGANISM="Stereomyxa ramosa, Strain Chinc5" /LENGTH=357 /DNA_ID=CAMNT_0015367189 /DNA_START=957 /DNA_END=2030 /DNA_ORIENTATION=+